MPKIIQAVYKDGVLKPTRKLRLRDSQKVTLKVVSAEAPPDRLALLDRLLTYEGSGRGDLAARSEEYLRQIFHEQRRRSR